MAKTGISKQEVAKRQLVCALRMRLANEDSIAVHTLAYAAFGVLKGLVSAQEHRIIDVLDVLYDQSSKMGRDFSGVPNFLKHADQDPDAMLAEHSAKTVHLTLAFAVRLWIELGNQPTSEMLEFARLPDPYKPGYRASELVKLAQNGPLRSEEDQAEWRMRLRGALATDTS